MNREEAEAQAVKLAAEHPDRETHRFLARQGDGGEWSVVKINIPPVDENLIAETRADEKPAQGEDPRDNLSRDVGGPYGGI